MKHTRVTRTRASSLNWAVPYVYVRMLQLDLAENLALLHSYNVARKQ